MKNNTLNKFIALLLALVFMVSITACGRSSKTAKGGSVPVNVAVIIGSHSNAPVANISLAESYIRSACRSFGSVCLVADDGEPYSKVIDIPEQEGLSKNKYESIADSQTSEILRYASGMTAQTPEVNSVKALQTASRYLASCEGERKLIIIDSMLATTGVLSFTSGLLEGCNSQTIIDQLNSANELPSLNGVQVIAYTVGDLANPQPQLSERERSNLINIWTEIFNACGVAEIEIKNDLPLSDSAPGNLPVVSLVPVLESAVDCESVANALDNGQALMCDIAFLPDSVELVNQQVAEQTLAEVIAYAKANPSVHLLVCGCTASAGDEQSCRDFSFLRAEKICELLLASGVNSTPYGCGYSSCLYINDRDAVTGVLLEPQASLNRTVKIINADSPLAKSIC